MFSLLVCKAQRFHSFLRPIGFFPFIFCPFPYLSPYLLIFPSLFLSPPILFFLLILETQEETFVIKWQQVNGQRKLGAQTTLQVTVLWFFSLNLPRPTSVLSLAVSLLICKEVFEDVSKGLPLCSNNCVNTNLMFTRENAIYVNTSHLPRNTRNTMYRSFPLI